MAILIVANKYSPSNFWCLSSPIPPSLPILLHPALIPSTPAVSNSRRRNGRWRSAYHLTPGSGALRGRVHADVHYYEDGNVRLTAAKPMELTAGTTAPEIGRAIGRADRAYQEELNRGLARLSEGAFKALRRQLPVTRQKVRRLPWCERGWRRTGEPEGGGRKQRLIRNVRLTCVKGRLGQDRRISLGTGYRWRQGSVDAEHGP